MPRDRKLAEVARSIHRASERLWARVVERDKYDVASTDVETLQRLTTELSRAITKLKLKRKEIAIALRIRAVGITTEASSASHAVQATMPSE